MIRWLSKQWWCPINCYGPCTGLTLYRWGQHKAELWYAPAWYSVPLHSHDHVDVEFLILHAKGCYIFRHKDGIQGELVSTPQVLGKLFTVKAGVPHGFNRSDSSLIWINFEHWKDGHRPTSVAQDFTLR